MNKTQQTVTIEEMLKVGQSISTIARSVGVSRQRVHHIKSAMERGSIAANRLARRIKRDDIKKRYGEHVKSLKTPKAQHDP